MTENTCIGAYLAGAIDGDGTMRLYQHRDRKARRQFSWRPVLRLLNTNKEWLEGLKQDLGMGRIGYLGMTPPSNSNRKREYELTFTAGEMRIILPQILPFLRIKKENAELLITVLKITENHRKREYKKNIEEIDAVLTPIYEKLKVLNHRGK